MLETLKHIDQVLFHFINHDLANPVFDVICPIWRDKRTWIPFYVIMFFLFWKLYQRKALGLTLSAVLTIVFSDQISSSLIKPFFHRLRPCNNPNLASSARLLLHDCGVGYSFVSSHAANHFAIATFIWFFIPVNKKKASALILFLWASSIALSQVYVGVHYPADILAGALLGIAIGTITGYATRKFLHLAP